MNSGDAFDRVVERERSHHRRRRRRKSRRGLVVHAWIYAIVNLALIAAWSMQRLVLDRDDPAWWVSTAVGWGVGLAVHTALVYRPWRRAREHRGAGA